MTAAFSDYIVYVDESGDHSLVSIDPEYPIFVLSFCIFRKDEYAQAMTPAVRRLKFETFGHDMAILHEIDIRKKKGLFSKLGKEARVTFPRFFVFQQAGFMLPVFPSVEPSASHA